MKQEITNKLKSQEEIPEVSKKILIKDTYDMGLYYERKSRSLTNIRPAQI